MKIEKQFNKRAAALVDVQPPSVSTRPGLALGIRLTFNRGPNDLDNSTIAMHLTPDEALALALQLIAAAR